MSGHRPWAQIKRRKVLKALTAHQLDVLRDYGQLGTIAAVADFRGVQVATINNTLGIVRDKLGVATTREALMMLAARQLEASS